MKRIKEKRSTTRPLEWLGVSRSTKDIPVQELSIVKIRELSSVIDENLNQLSHKIFSDFRTKLFLLLREYQGLISLENIEQYCSDFDPKENCLERLQHENAAYNINLLLRLSTDFYENLEYHPEVFEGAIRDKLSNVNLKGESNDCRK